MLAMLCLHLALAILPRLSNTSPFPTISMQRNEAIRAIFDYATSAEETPSEPLSLPRPELTGANGTENSLFFTVVKRGELVDRYVVTARTANCSNCTITKTVRDANQTRVDFEMGKLLPGRLYDVAVVAQRANVTSDPLNFSFLTTPSAPVSITPVNLSADAVKLRWTLPSASGYDQFVVEVGDNKFFVKEENFILPLQFTPGARVKGSIRTVKGKRLSKTSQFSLVTKPLPPVNVTVSPDFVRALFCVCASLNTERSFYDNCHLLYYSLNDSSETLGPLNDHVAQAMDLPGGGGKECRWWLPLIPGKSYNFTVRTSIANKSFSDSFTRDMLVTPAFDMKRFGVLVEATENSLYVAWNHTAISSMWARLLGPNGSLRATLFMSYPSNRTLPFYRSKGVLGPSGDTLHFQNLASGTCYRLVVGSSVDGVESEHTESVYKRTAPALLSFSLSNATSRTARFVSPLAASVSVGSGCKLRATLQYNIHNGLAERDETISIVRMASQGAMFDLAGLRPYTIYNLSLEEVCGYLVELCPQGRLKLLKNISFKTPEAPPGPVTLITPIIVSPYEVNVVWKPTDEPNGHLLAYKLTVYPSPTGRVPITEPPWTLLLPVSATNCSVANLTGGGRYAFDVVAVNKAGDGPRYHERHMDSLPSVVTYVWSPPKPKEVPCVVAGSQHQDEFTVRFNVSVLSTKHGLLEHYAFVVSEGDKPVETNLTLSWHDVQPFEIWPPYIAIMKPLPPVKQFNSAPVTEVVGIDSHCSRLSAAEVRAIRGSPFCNGPLRPGRKFRVKVRLFTTSELFTDSDYSDVILTAYAREIASGSLLAVILALMVFLTVAMIGMVVVRARRIDLHAEWCRLRSKMSSPKAGIVRSFVQGRKAFKSRIIKSSSSSNKPSKLPSKGAAIVQSPYCLPSSNGSSRPVRKVDFAKHMMVMSADSDFLFSEEFELLKPVGRTLSMAAADLPCNRTKNRFTNILPYDYSRVKLSSVDDDEGSDYINANYISGYNNPREYIATQGPMPSTRDDFWRMVWEQQCLAIVNLTRCVEKGREKCDQYWPLDAKTMIYGDVEVVVLNESRLPYWTIREFLLQKGGVQRRVKNFHFTAWPDFGVPDQPKVLIDFVRLFRAQINAIVHKPVVVHCSAGVGRSGTFIALDQLLQHVRSADDVIDVFETVYQMRKERVWMVQSEQQYVFIHHCLLAAIEESEERRATVQYGLVMQPVGKNEVHQNPAFDDDDDNDEGIAESGV